MKSSWISPIVIGFVVCGFFMTVRSPAEAQEERAGHLVPADKKLSQDAVQRLFVRKDSLGERGRREEGLPRRAGPARGLSRRRA